MKYRIKQIQCRPWTLCCLSVALIESHYENMTSGHLGWRAVGGPVKVFP